MKVFGYDVSLGEFGHRHHAVDALVKLCDV